LRRPGSTAEPGVTQQNCRAVKRIHVICESGLNPVDGYFNGLLNDRDVILIDRSQTSGMAGLYVLRIDGEIIVKTLQRLPEGVLEVSSANPAYKPFTVNMSKPPSDFAIIGRVVWFGRQV
ncbi:S24 family peptidase, partial [Burkholderia anthina]|uniref:S24 family peptidase n=1 Tax=Burkholderia anthina TaxID=179879 RepID=UPI001588CC58